jgi:hypothetical protein
VRSQLLMKQQPANGAARQPVLVLCGRPQRRGGEDRSPT